MCGHYGQTKWARPISSQVVALSFEYVFFINLLWKLGLGLGLDLQLHYFRIFCGEQLKQRPYLRRIVRKVTSC